MEAFFQGAEMGSPENGQKLVNLTVQVPDATRHKLKRIALEKQIPLKDLLQSLFERELDHHQAYSAQVTSPN